eukprot:1059003-Pelagomonas_calceolata.AAC.4
MDEVRQVEHRKLKHVLQIANFAVRNFWPNSQSSCFTNDPPCYADQPSMSNSGLQTFRRALPRGLLWEADAAMAGRGAPLTT